MFLPLLIYIFLKSRKQLNKGWLSIKPAGDFCITFLFSCVSARALEHSVKKPRSFGALRHFSRQNWPGLRHMKMVIHSSTIHNLDGLGHKWHVKPPFSTMQNFIPTRFEIFLQWILISLHCLMQNIQNTFWYFNWSLICPIEGSYSFFFLFSGELSEGVIPHLLDNKCSVIVITAGKGMFLKYFCSWRNGLERLSFHQSGRTVERKYGRKFLYNFCRVAICQTPLPSIILYLFFWCNHIKKKSYISL